MSKFRIYTLCALSIFVLIGPIFPHPAFADTQSQILTAFTNQGNEAVKNQNLSEAIRNYSRALLVDLYYKKAQEGLLTIANDPSLGTENKFDLLYFNDLLLSMENLQDKVAYFYEKREALTSQLFQRGYSQADYTDMLMLIEAKIGSMAQPKEYKIAGRFFDHQEPLKLVNEMLRLKNEELSDQVKYLGQQFAQLREINRQTVYFPVSFTEVTPQTVNTVSSDVSARGAKLIRPAVISVAATQIHHDDVEILARQLALVQQQLGNVHALMREKDDKVRHLTNQVVDFALKLSETESALEKKIENLSSLNDQFFELQSRFELGQKLIAEKDERLSVLSKEVEELKTANLAHYEELNNILNSKDEKLLEFNGILQIYKGKLIDANEGLKQKQASITTLEDQLDNAQVLIYEKDLALQKTEESLKVLEEQLSDVKEKLLQIQRGTNHGNFGYKSKGHDIDQLESKLLDMRHFIRSQISSVYSTDFSSPTLNFYKPTENIKTP